MSLNKRAEYDEICHETYRRIYSYCYERTDRHREATEDVVQNVFMILWEKFDQLRVDPNTNYRAWLYKVADLKLKEYYRAKKKHRRESKNLEIHEASAAMATEPDMIEAVMQRRVTQNEARYTEEILEQLSAEERELYRQVYIEDIGYQELAKQQGVSEASLRMRTMRLRNHVKEIVRQVCSHL